MGKFFSKRQKQPENHPNNDMGDTKRDVQNERGSEPHRYTIGSTRSSNKRQQYNSNIGISNSQRNSWHNLQGDRSSLGSQRHSGGSLSSLLRSQKYKSEGGVSRQSHSQHVPTSSRYSRSSVPVDETRRSEGYSNRSVQNRSLQSSYQRARSTENEISPTGSYRSHRPIDRRQSGEGIRSSANSQGQHTYSCRLSHQSLPVDGNHGSKGQVQHTYSCRLSHQNLPAEGNQRSERHSNRSLLLDSPPRRISSSLHSRNKSVQNFENELSPAASYVSRRSFDSGFYETLVEDSKSRQFTERPTHKSLGIRALPKSTNKVYGSTVDQRRAFEKGVTQTTHSHAKMFKMFMGDRCGLEKCHRPPGNDFEDFKKNCWQKYREEQQAKKMNRRNIPQDLARNILQDREINVPQHIEINEYPASEDFENEKEESPKLNVGSATKGSLKRYHSEASQMNHAESMRSIPKFQTYSSEACIDGEAQRCTTGYTGSIPVLISQSEEGGSRPLFW